MINETVHYTLQDFRIGTRTYDNYSMTTHHFHDTYELYYMNEGSRDYFINDTTHKIQEGNLVLIKPNDLHKTMDTGVRHSRVLINFNANFIPFIDTSDLLNLCFGQSRILTFDLTTQQQVEELLREMILIAKSEDDYSPSKLQSLLMNLLFKLSDHIKKIQGATESVTPMPAKVYELLHYLKANYNQTNTLDNLSTLFFVSPYHMTRIFKTTTGFTIFEYIHSLRVIEAKRLLKETSNTISKISQDVGFSNASSFGKVFKSITGISPLNYRRTHQ